MEAIGRRRWAIAEAIPSETLITDRTLVLMTTCILNAADREVLGAITIVQHTKLYSRPRGSLAIVGHRLMRKADRLVMSQYRDHLQCGTFSPRGRFPESCNHEDCSDRTSHRECAA